MRDLHCRASRVPPHPDRRRYRHLQPRLEDLLSTGTGYVVCNVETDQAAFVRRVAKSHPHVKVRINRHPVVVACGDPQTLYREVDRILSIAAGRPNCLLGTGCLPLETPPENIRLIKDYIA